MKYVQDLQEAVACPDLRQQATEAYGEYMRILQEVYTGIDSERAKGAYERYLHTLEQAFANGTVQRRCADAFHAYIKALREAWLGIDADSLDPAFLAAIAESMYNAAWLGFVNTGGSSFSSAAPSDVSPST